MDPTAVNWSLYDKLAAFLVLVLMSGYYLAPIGHVVTTTLNLVLGPLTTLLPFSVLLFCLSGSTGVVSTVARHRLQDTERLQQLRERMEELNDRLQEAGTHHDGADGSDNGADSDLDPQADREVMMRSFLTTMKLQLRPGV